MQFGIGVSTHITNWEIVRHVEELGYDRAWFGDSQMIWSDCYATMALAAQNTRRWDGTRDERDYIPRAAVGSIL